MCHILLHKNKKIHFKKYSSHYQDKNYLLFYIRLIIIMEERCCIAEECTNGVCAVPRSAGAQHAAFGQIN